MRNQTVLISGASIAGPALAYWLSRYGFHVTVVERAPELRPGGQAIDFKGQTHRTVLERMGIWAEIQQRQTGKFDTVYLDDAGRELAIMPGEFTGGDVEIMRGDLSAIMYERTAARCEYRFGDSITALTETAGGVQVEFEHGTPQTFDLVIGADGIHSRVRRLAFGPEQDFVRHLGYYYCVAGAPGAADRPGLERTRPDGGPGRLEGVTPVPVRLARTGRHPGRRRGSAAADHREIRRPGRGGAVDAGRAGRPRWLLPRRHRPGRDEGPLHRRPRRPGR